MKRVVRYAGWLLVLALAQGVRAQVQVGDDLRMNLNGLLTAGYTGNYGDQIPSNHSLGIWRGRDAQRLLLQSQFFKLLRRLRTTTNPGPIRISNR